MRAQRRRVLAFAFADDLLVGLILGCFVGLLAGPLLRAWLIRREWTRASSEADLFGGDLDRVEDPGAVAAPPVRTRTQAREA